MVLSLRRRPAPAERPCENCGRPFTPGESHNPGRFCTRACAYEARRVGPALQPRPCEQCGKTFTPKSSADAGRFCSHECYWQAEARYPEPGERVCARDGCENRFRPTPSHAAASGARYCGWSCSMLDAWRTGQVSSAMLQTPRARQRWLGRWSGHKGAAAGVEAGRAKGGRPAQVSPEQAVQILTLSNEGLSSRAVAERVFGDRRFQKRVLRFLNR